MRENDISAARIIAIVRCDFLIMDLEESIKTNADEKDAIVWPDGNEKSFGADISSEIVSSNIKGRGRAISGFKIRFPTRRHKIRATESVKPIFL